MGTRCGRWRCPGHWARRAGARYSPHASTAPDPRRSQCRSRCPRRHANGPQGRVAASVTRSPPRQLTKKMKEEGGGGERASRDGTSRATAVEKETAPPRGQELRLDPLLLLLVVVVHVLVLLLRQRSRSQAAKPLHSEGRVAAPETPRQNFIHCT